MPSRFNSTVKLYNVTSINRGRFPFFSSISNQTQYFDQFIQHTIPNCKIVRGKGTIRVNLPVKELYKQITYLSYINPDYDNKIIYGIVKGYSYVNDQCSELSFDIDFIQTYMFDVQCEGNLTSIERQHLSKGRKELEDANPFDINLWELNTTETLPISHDIFEWDFNYQTHEYEKPTTGSNPVIRNDTEMLYGTVPTTYGELPEYKTLVYLSHIDLTDIESEGTPAQDILDDYLRHPTYATDFSIDYDGTVSFGINGQTYYNGSNLFSQFPSDCAILCLERSSAVDGDHSVAALLDLLTRWGCLSSIVNIVSVPLAMLLTAFYDSQELDDEIYSVNLTIPELNVTNKKLYRSPYSFIRLTTPDYNVKELQWERFRNLAEASSIENQVAEIALCCDIINGVTAVAMPCHYNVRFANKLRNSSIDTSNVVKYSNFPTAPYTIDAYLSQLSALAQERVKGDTMVNAKKLLADNYSAYMRSSGSYQAFETADAIIGSVTGIGASMTAGLSPANSARIVVTPGVDNGTSTPAVFRSMIDTGINQEQRQYAQDAFMTDLRVTADAEGFLRGGDSGMFGVNYSEIKPAYAADRYVAPSGGGFDNYTSYGWLNIAMQKVKLLPAYLAMYDKYFDKYGYASGDTGTPYIMNFVNGDTTSDNSPYWNSEGETYIKTVDAHFTGTFQYVCDLWASVFNAGIHCINGDDLING